MNITRTAWRARLTGSVVLGSLIASMALAGGAAASVSQQAAGCRPGSGANFAGKQITSSMLQPGSSQFRCANLTGADLSGQSLGQMDFTNALLRNANLQHADLTQATLSGAILSGANLSNATMIQVTAHQTNFSGANLTNVDATQAELQGANLSGANLSGTKFDQADMTGANLTKAKVGGASFTQATLTNANFTGATGVAPWSLYLLIVTGLIFILLVVGSLRRRASQTQLAGRGSGNGRLIRGLIGAVVVVLGIHLFLGGLLGEILSAAGPPLTQTCTGPTCAVGVASGFIGLFGGVFVFLAGLAIRASGRSKQTVGLAGSGPIINPGQFMNQGGFNNPGGLNNPGGGFNNPGGLNNPGGFNNPGSFGSPGPANPPGPSDSPGPFS